MKRSLENLGMCMHACAQLSVVLASESCVCAFRWRVCVDLSVLCSPVCFVLLLGAVLLHL